MRHLFGKYLRIYYPYAVEPYGDEWQVLFVRSENPQRKAVFDSWDDAFARMWILNEGWRREQKAGLEARRVLSRIQNKAAVTASRTKWHQVVQRLRLVPRIAFCRWYRIQMYLLAWNCRPSAPLVFGVFLLLAV